MATMSFQYAYLVSGGFAYTGNPTLDPTVDTGTDATLTSGESFTATVPGDPNTYDFTFSYASGDGFVAVTNGIQFWFTNEERSNGDPVPQDGDSFIVCFLAGTLIATPAGARPVETLRAGDLVLTSEGLARPVRWLARQTVSTLFADKLRVLPIRIAAGALGENLPERDLYVSPDHALLVEGLLIQAGALVNGTTITRYRDVPRSFVYYHVELEDHSLILAEGVPAESFVDNVTRRAFDNWREAPEASPIAELDLPRVKAWRQLPHRVRARLEQRALHLLGRETIAA